MVIYLSSLLQNLIQGSRLLMNSKEKTRLIVLHFQILFIPGIFCHPLDQE